MILQKPNTCMYESRIRGSFVKPKATWVNPQGEDLSSLAQTSILQEKDSVFATESSTEIPCGEPPPSFLTTNVESSLTFAQQSGMQQLRPIYCIFTFSEEVNVHAFNINLH